ncbi:MAG: hypothetical protein ACE15D_10675 [Candidatus Eisenbacteria bacterium]
MPKSLGSLGGEEPGSLLSFERVPAVRSRVVAVYLLAALALALAVPGARSNGAAEKSAGGTGRSDLQRTFVGPDAFAVSFDSEWIRLAVLGDSLEVRASYFLRCREPDGARVTLFFPFPEDSLLGPARMISLHAGVERAALSAIPWRPMPPTSAMSAVRFETPPCTGDTVFVDAVYRQQLLGPYARYIVTTTRAWHRPLRHARFDVRLPEGAVPIDFSFPFEAREDSVGRFYSYEVDSFYPDRDIIVRWKGVTGE